MNKPITKMIQNTNEWLRSEKGQKSLSKCVKSAEKISKKLEEIHTVDRKLLQEPMTI